MNSALVGVQYRPVKICFLIEEDNIEDFIYAVGLNSLLWGGIYNPIIPYNKKIDITEGIINNFQVDIINACSKNTNIIKYVNSDFMRKNLFPGNSQIYYDSNGELCYTDISNLLEDSNYIIRLSGTESCYYDISGSLKYSNLLKTIFGFYPTIPNNKYLFIQQFTNKLSAKVCKITTKTKLDIFHNTNTPIKFTAADILRKGSLKDHASLRSNNNGIYIGKADDFNDLIYFWNLRAYGYNLQYYDIDHPKLFELNIDDFIKWYDNSEKESSFEGRVKFFYRKKNEKYLDVFSAKVKGSLLTDGLTDNYAELLFYTKPFSFSSERSFSLLSYINQQNNKYQVSFSLPERPFKDNWSSYKDRQNYMASVTLENEPYRQTLNLPYLKSLDEFYSRSVVGDFEPFSLKVQPNGIGIFVRNETKSLTLSPIPFREVIIELFKNAGLECKSSQPGILANKIISKLGHLEACRVFKIRGVRKLFKVLKVEDAQPLSYIEREIYDNGGFTRYEKLFIEKREHPKLSKQDVINFLFRHDFFKAGLELKCGSCRLKNWLPIRRLDDFWECEYCGYSNLLITDLKDRGDWKFRKSGLLGKENNQEGSIPVILTLLQLYRCLQTEFGKHNMIYETALSVTQPIACEVDFCIVNTRYQNDFEVGFGECKDEGGTIDKKDIENLIKVYEKFKEKQYKPYIIISKAADRFKEEELALFKEVHKRDIRLVLFTNAELEPYFVYEAHFQNTIPKNKYPSSLQDLHSNTIELFLQPSTNQK